MTKLSQTGELALLAELERRGLIVGTEHDAAQVAGVVVTQDALVENVHFRLDWLSWRELGFRAAAVNISDLAASGARPEALLVTLALPRRPSVDDVLALYEGIAEAGVPVVGGDTTAAPVVLVSVTALGRTERVPGRAGARAGRPARRHRPARRRRRGLSRAALHPAAAACRRGSGARANCARDARPLRRARRRRRAHRPPLRRCAVSSTSTASRSPRARPSPISASARTTSCSPPFRTPGAFPVVGRVEAGEGVELPAGLTGWQHFA